MSDETEAIRRQQLVEINAQPGSREALEAEHGQVWDTRSLGRTSRWRDSWPLRCRPAEIDGQRGSLMFQHNPRFYFGFELYEG